MSELDGFKSRVELDETGLESLLSFSSTDDVIGILREHGVPCAPVVEGYNMGFFSDPQAQANSMATTLVHPSLGDIHYSGNLVSFGDLDTLPKRPTPLLGQNTAEILAELGYDEEQTRELYESDVVTTESAA